MMRVHVASPGQFDWLQTQVIDHHYLHTPVDSRCSPMGYVVTIHDQMVGGLLVGRPEATRCYQGDLTYGSIRDVQDGRAHYDRWEILNLARVWMSPLIQPGGAWHTPDHLPGFVDRRGVFRSTVTSMAIHQMLERVNRDYLLFKPPVFLDQPYAIRVVLSYCDTRIHRGTIYQAAGFWCARTNERGIATWYTDKVAPLTPADHAAIHRASQQSLRSQRIRAQRSTQLVQAALFDT